MNAGSPLEEYKIVCEFLRSHAALRFLRFTVLLGATGGLVTALLSERLQALPLNGIVLKIGGLGLTVAFTIMEYSSSMTWHKLRERANELAMTLQFKPFPESSPWNPLTTTGASRYLHLLFIALWVFILVRG
jgi:hypothetical protein